MRSEQVDILIANRNEESMATLTKKGKIYSSESDKLRNFKSVAAMNEVTQQEALWGMVSKHIIATKDQIYSGRTPTRSWITDYLGDIHNYLYLLEAIWLEQKNKEIEEIEDKIKEKEGK